MSAATATGASAPSARIVKLDSAQPLTKPSKTKTKKSGNKASPGPKKRKADEPSSSEEEEDADDDDEDDDEDEEDVDFVNVDLDFFNFIDTDYLAIKNLLVQLFSHDAKDLDLAGLADHLVEQEVEVGTGIKSDGEESDPLAIIGVLPWSGDKSHLASLRTYLLGKTATVPALHALLEEGSKGESSTKVGVVFSERLVNMPVQVVPPLLRIFNEELESLTGDFAFTHLLFISKTFLASSGDADVDMDAPSQPDATATKQKKKKKKGNKGGAVLADANASQTMASESFLYHLEDELLAKSAGDGMWTEYKFTNAPVRGQMGPDEDFGVEMRGRITLVERSKMAAVVQEAETVFSA